MLKKVIITIIVCIILVIGIIGWGFINSDDEVINVNPEIIPQEEISDEQMRNTVVLIYYVDTENGNIVSESNLIDAKRLLDNPYKELIDLWLKGSNNNKYTNFCGNNVLLNGVELNNNVLTVDFSKEFVDEFNGGSDDVLKSINSLVNTLTELTEIECVRIKVDGQENVYLNNINLFEKYCRIP